MPTVASDKGACTGAELKRRPRARYPKYLGFLPVFFADPRLVHEPARHRTESFHLLGATQVLRSCGQAGQARLSWWR